MALQQLPCAEFHITDRDKNVLITVESDEYGVTVTSSVTNQTILVEADDLPDLIEALQQIAAMHAVKKAA